MTATIHPEAIAHYGSSERAAEELAKLKDRKAAIEAVACKLPVPLSDWVYGWQLGTLSADIDFIENGSPF